jgi:cytochrome P450
VGQTLSSCRLLQACIEEAMRLSPPVSGLLLRQVLQGGLLIAARWHVPAGTDVGIPSYAIHRCGKYWQHPNQFKPERWLQKESQDCRSTFMPFGVGRTICVGKQLAYNEMTLVILASCGPTISILSQVVNNMMRRVFQEAAVNGVEGM